MIALATLLTLINQVVGTPYIPVAILPPGPTLGAGFVGIECGDEAGRFFGDRFNTGNEETPWRLRAGNRPNALLIGWNGHHGGDAARWHARIQW